MPGNLLDYWLAGAATVGGLALAIASARYRIPDLIRRIEKLEAERPLAARTWNQLEAALKFLRTKPVSPQRTRSGRLPHFKRYENSARSVVKKDVNPFLSLCLNVNETFAIPNL